MPNKVNVTVTMKELADEFEALAVTYEELVQKIRYEADRLRQGYELSLDIRATQATPTPPAADPRHIDKEWLESFNNTGKAE